MAIKKVINSQSQTFQPILTDTLVLDAVPTVNSFNGVTSDAVARAVAGASGEVPQVTENDNGKILTAIYDAGGPAVEWAEAPTGIPEAQSSDNGKILGVVDANGTMAWVDKPVSNVTTKDKKIDIGVNGSGYPVEISYSATLGSIPGSKDLAAKSFDASDRTHTAVALKSWNYAQDGGLSAGNVAKLVIPESGSFGVYGESLIICYFNSTNNVSGTYIFLGGEDTGDGWPTYMNDMGYVAGTYDLPVEPPSAGSQSCDSIGILLNLSDIDASAADIAAAKAHMEEVMAGWIIQWPANTTGYNVSIPDIPAVTSADNNKVLTATWNSSTSTGSFGWATAGGGGGAASISDIIRDIDASNVQAGQTMQDWVNGLVSDIQAGKLIRLIAIEYSGDYTTDIAYLDHYNIADSADPNDHMSSTYYFESKRYTYFISNPDAVDWELSRSPNT